MSTLCNMDSVASLILKTDPKDFLPGRPGHVGATSKDNRLFVEAVLYRYRAGIPWRDLPEPFGDFRVVHTRFSRWCKSGILFALINTARGQKK